MSRVTLQAANQNPGGETNLETNLLGLIELLAQAQVRAETRPSSAYGRVAANDNTPIYKKG
ncbi:hypothetical protein BD830_106365 [Maritimibacter alkaliphilus HTCC2654]|nr:hypothetical protein BD830_106365 [Maritimibacter alkaliphilus HTCC2654]